MTDLWLHVRCCSFRSLDDHVRDPVSQVWSAACVSFSHSATHRGSEHFLNIYKHLKSIIRILRVLKSYLSASSTCACLPAYSWAVRVSSLLITSWLMSMRLQRRSEITSLAWSTAPWGSLIKQISNCHLHNKSTPRSGERGCKYKHSCKSLYLSMRIFCRQVLMRLATRGQLSLRTVSIPLQSILSCVSALDEK